MHTHKHTYAWVCIHMYMQAHKYIYIYKHTHICMNTCILRHRHTHIHIALASLCQLDTNLDIYDKRGFYFFPLLWYLYFLLFLLFWHYNINIIFPFPLFPSNPLSLLSFKVMVLSFINYCYIHTHTHTEGDRDKERQRVTYKCTYMHKDMNIQREHFHLKFSVIIAIYSRFGDYFAT